MASLPEIPSPLHCEVCWHRVCPSRQCESPQSHLSRGRVEIRAERLEHVFEDGAFKGEDGHRTSVRRQLRVHKGERAISVARRRVPATPSAGTPLLSVIGAINWDVSVFEERFARAGEEVPVRRVEEFSGGKGANAAVAASRVLGRGRVACIGALGDDEVAKAQLSELASEGVLLDGVVEIKGCRSGQAYILIDGAGGKTIHTYFGANARIAPRHIRQSGCAGVLSRTGMMVVMDPPTAVAQIGRASCRERV